MEQSTKEIVKFGIDKATTEFTEKVSDLGFQRTKKWFWVREQDYGANFIHIHVSGSSYGGPINNSVSFRVHTGYRSFNDSFDALHLNGPNSDEPEYREHRFHLRFNAKSWSTYDRCITDLVRFVTDVCEPWLSQQKLDKTMANNENILLSRKLLGLKKVKKAPNKCVN